MSTIPSEISQFCFLGPQVVVKVLKPCNLGSGLALVWKNMMFAPGVPVWRNVAGLSIEEALRKCVYVCVCVGGDGWGDWGR